MSATVPGQVRAARAFVAAVVCGSPPHVDVALLLASELVTNSLRFGGSTVRGGLVTVTVAADGAGVRVKVTGRSGDSDSAPVLLPAVDACSDAEGSRGCGSWTSSPRGGG